MCAPAPAELPAEPGVYLFRGARGEILYVGKARCLRRRVRSYFRAGRGASPKTRALVPRVRAVELLVVRSEREALLLEERLIRAHRPSFNQRLKDGGGYPFLEIDLHAPVPRVSLAGSVAREGAACFGPFPGVGGIREALRVIRRLYTVRRESFERRPAATALADRRRMAAELVELLEGRGSSLLQRIESAMRGAADAMAFERAARLRAALAVAEAMAGCPRPGAVAAGTPEVVARIRLELAAGSRGRRTLLPPAEPVEQPGRR